jgi:hypothetical protein
MDKRLGLFLYCESTFWVQNTVGFFYFYGGDSYSVYDTRFLYREEKDFLGNSDELRLGPYEMVEW